VCYAVTFVIYRCYIHKIFRPYKVIIGYIYIKLAKHCLSSSLFWNLVETSSNSWIFFKSAVTYSVFKYPMFPAFSGLLGYVQSLGMVCSSCVMGEVYIWYASVLRDFRGCRFVIRSCTFNTVPENQILIMNCTTPIQILGFNELGIHIHTIYDGYFKYAYISAAAFSKELSESIVGCNKCNY
jgi:hypothetical protein